MLVGLFWHNDSLRVLLTKRSERLRRHSGEVSFPGGRAEAADRNLISTALRETHEEIGLAPSEVELLGTLDDMPSASSGFVIRPVVGRVPYPYEFVLDEREVDRLITPPLDLFADPTTLRTEYWTRGGRTYPVFLCDYEGDVIWGATARILVALLERLDGKAPAWVTVPDAPASVEPDV